MPGKSRRKQSPTMNDTAVNTLICEELELDRFDTQAVKQMISQFSIKHDGQINIVSTAEINLQL